jgi:hypothetical protein
MEYLTRLNCDRGTREGVKGVENYETGMRMKVNSLQGPLSERVLSNGVVENYER